jgi:hypothetical protein
VKKDRTPFKIEPGRHKEENEKGEEVITEFDDYKNEKSELVTPIDLLFHTMWKSCDVIVQHNTISSCGTFYPYKAMVDTILETTQTEKDLLKNSQGYFKDLTNPSNPHPFGGIRGKKPYDTVNEGNRERFNWAFQGNVLEMIGPLRTDFWNQEHLLLNNVDMTVKLDPSTEQFRLMWSPKNLDCEIQFLDLQLILRRVRLQKKVLDGMNVGLSTLPAQYPHKKSDIRVYQIPKGSFSKTLDDIWQNQVPTKVIAFLVDAEAFNGVSHKNPLHFQNCNITSIGMHKDYSPITHEPWDISFENGLFMEPLMAMWRITQLDGKIKNIGVDKKQFKDAYSIFCFDVDPSVPYDLSFWGPIRKGVMKMHMTFGEGLKSDMNLILYATFPGTVQIDITRAIVRETPLATS